MISKRNSLLAIALFLFAASFAQVNKNRTVTIRKVTTGHPAWSAQSNIYEVNLRQYTESSSIKEFQKSLPRLRKMGVEILWFMPITPIGIEGRKMTSLNLLFSGPPASASPWL